jgi:hypothetical protein
MREEMGRFPRCGTPIWGPDKELLHVVIRLGDKVIDDLGRPVHRADVSEPNDPLQLAVIAAPAAKEFGAHAHKLKPAPSEHVTQETWIVARGSVRVAHYDRQGRHINTAILHAGDCTITYAGGHAYTILERDTFVYELKTGPYHGHEADKVTI